MIETDLPIRQVLPELLSSCERSSRVVLEAPPGSGKSTIVPLALLDAAFLSGKKILLLQPRRLAARTLAMRMAELLGESVGDTVGYRVRFDTRVSSKTRVEVLTEGILTRMLHDDPELPGVGAVIFDEFHERSLHADLSLAICREVQQTLRPELRLMIMSATMETDTLARELDAVVVRGAGTPYPVEVEYLAEDPKGDLAGIAARETVRVAQRTEGDILVFLPGYGEIREVSAQLNERPGFEVFELYGDLPYERQKAALRPGSGDRRKVILSTPIAETSLTIEGVRVVIDSGFARVPRFDPSSGLSRLATERISKDAAEQRTGRAGRLGPGTCLRLWSLHTQHTLRPKRTPEILEADLSAFALEVARWGSGAKDTLPWIDAPPKAAWQQGTGLLETLGALDPAGEITAIGEEMRRLATHPRLARLLIAAAKIGLLPLAAELTALLEERDIFLREADSVDLEERVEILRRLRRGKSGGGGQISRAQVSRVERLAEEWAKRLRTKLVSEELPHGEAGMLLLYAYPERIAKRRESSAPSDRETKYLLSSGPGAVLSKSPLSKSELLVVARMHMSTGDGRIFLAAPVDEGAVREHCAERIVTSREIAWNEREGKVVVQNNERLGALVIGAKLAEATEEEIHPLLIEQLRKAGGIALLDWSEEARSLQGKIRFAREVAPELELEDLSDAALDSRLEEALTPFLGSTRRFEQVKKLEALPILEAAIPWSVRKELDRLFPTTLPIAKGKARRIDYTGETPVFAATVQELFGTKTTPKIAGGRLPLTIHVLSPARRPIQITTDLESFWKNTYAEVRKELKGRYPKHDWPERPE